MLLLLSVLVIVFAAIEFHACNVMDSEMKHDLSAEMTP